MANIKFETIISLIRDGKTYEDKKALVEQYNSKALRNLFILSQHKTFKLPKPDSIPAARGDGSYVLYNFFNNADHYMYAINTEVAGRNLNRQIVQMNTEQYGIIDSLLTDKLDLGIDGSEFYPDILKKTVTETKETVPKIGDPVIIIEKTDESTNSETDEKPEETESANTPEPKKRGRKPKSE